jgi:hypothetical protein
VAILPLPHGEGAGGRGPRAGRAPRAAGHRGGGRLPSRAPARDGFGSGPVLAYLS